MKKQVICITAGLLVTVFAACGYRFEGGGYVHEDVSKVAVATFENRTTETRAGTSFTNELIREILQKTDTKVVDADQATRVIKGTITAITFSTLSRSSTETVTERKVTARVDVQLMGPDQEILWSVKDFTTSEDYTVQDDEQDDEESRRQAVDEIAERCAERLVSQMMTNF